MAEMDFYHLSSIWETGGFMIILTRPAFLDHSVRPPDFAADADGPSAKTFPSEMVWINTFHEIAGAVSHSHHG
jgi:hypothetical protein